MRSREIIKKLNDLMDKIQDALEESKKQKNMPAFVARIKALGEIKYALNMARHHLQEEIEPSNEPVL